MVEVVQWLVMAEEVVIGTVIVSVLLLAAVVVVVVVAQCLWSDRSGLVSPCTIAFVCRRAEKVRILCQVVVVRCHCMSVCLGVNGAGAVAELPVLIRNFAKWR